MVRTAELMYRGNILNMRWQGLLVLWWIPETAALSLWKLELHSKECIADAYQFVLPEQDDILQYCGSVILFIEVTKVLEVHQGW